MEPGVLFLLLIVAAKVIEAVATAGKKNRLPPVPGPARRPAPPRPEDDAYDAEAEYEDYAAHDQAGTVAGRPGDESAASVLPADLWEVLTGEKRPAEPPPGIPQSAPPRERPVPAGRDRLPRPDVARDRSARPDVVRDRSPRPDMLRDRSPRAQPARDRTLPAPLQPRPLPRQEERPFSYDEEGFSYDEETLRRRPAPYVEPRAESVPVRQAPVVVSMEELHIDDEARHTRFHQRLGALPAPPLSARPERPAADKPGGAYRFRTDADLRRAIIMSEVLGPPRGLQE